MLRRRRTKMRWGRGGRALVAIALVAGCGSRTGLLVDEEAPIDAGQDVRRLPDSGAPDLGVPDIGPEGLPPIDASVNDVIKTACPDAEATLVYILTQQNELYSFYPPTADFTFIGPIACPTTTAGATPFSMAVDRKGIAFSVFTDGELFRISTATAACRSTTYMPQQLGWNQFGMGYAADTTDTGETLYVAEGSFTGPSKGLASIDTTSYTLSFIGSFNPPIT